MSKTNTIPDSGSVASATAHVVALVSFLGAAGYAFLCASALGQRVSIAAELDRWELIAAMPYGFSEGDFALAAFGYLIGAVAWVAAGSSTTRAYWIVFTCPILGLLFMSATIFAPVRVMYGILFIPLIVSMAPFFVWLNGTRYRPSWLRQLHAKGLRRARNKMSNRGRRFEQLSKRFARGYTFEVIIWACAALAVLVVFLVRIPVRNVGAKTEALTVRTSQGDQVCWLLRADSAGYLILTQADEELRWINADDALAIAPAAFNVKPDGLVAKEINTTHELIKSIWWFIVPLFLLGGLWMVHSILQARLDATVRNWRRSKTRATP